MITPYYQKGGVTIYNGDLRDVCPILEEPGIVLCDDPYSKHVHGKSRAGSRALGGSKSARSETAKANISRAVDFGFEHLTATLRRFIAKESARLASRWVLHFSDTESSHLWRLSLQARGLDYARTAFWRKIGASPQFTGRMPAVALEAITICHRPEVKGGMRWNGGGKHGWYEQDFADTEIDLLYNVPIVLERKGQAGEARVHTTQKPEALMIQIVEDFSDPGEMIYDFTAGAMTTAIGALRAEGGPRRATCIEIKEEYCEVGAKRIEAEFSGIGYTRAEKRGQGRLFHG